jgi:hypothetical protein
MALKDPSIYQLMPGHAGRGRGGVKPVLITYHIQAGINDLYQEFLNRPADNQADCTVWSRRDGRVIRYLYDSDTPWTNGDVVNPDMSNPVIAGLVHAGVENTNPYALTIEHQATAGDGSKSTDGFTDAQYEGTAQITAYWCAKFGIPCDRSHIVGHYQVGNHKNCPGPLFDFNRVIKRAQELMSLDNTQSTNPTPTPPPPPPVIFVPETGHSIGYGFKDYWFNLDKLGDNARLTILGFPVTNEFDMVFSGSNQKRTVQLFERGALIHEAENPAPWDNHMMTTAQFLEAYDYAIAHGLVNPDPNSLLTKAKNETVRLTKWAEGLEATFQSYALAGLDVPKIKAFGALLAAMRSGVEYDDYVASLKGK